MTSSFEYNYLHVEIKLKIFTTTDEELLLFKFHLTNLNTSKLDSNPEYNMQ